jgi:alpha-N-acetylglucosamine transferase
MAKKQKEKPEQAKVTINDKEYMIEDLSDEQKAMINHIADLDRKINSSKFNLEQLTFGKDAFFNSLNASLESG